MSALLDCGFARSYEASERLCIGFIHVLPVHDIHQFMICTAVPDSKWASSGPVLHLCLTCFLIGLELRKCSEHGFLVFVLPLTCDWSADMPISHFLPSIICFLQYDQGGYALSAFISFPPVSAYNSMQIGCAASSNMQTSIDMQVLQIDCSRLPIRSLLKQMLAGWCS